MLTLRCLLTTGWIAFWSNMSCAEPVGGEVFGDWTTACEVNAASQRVCNIFQRIAAKESGKSVLHVAVARPASAKRPVAIFNLPLGVALQPGVMIKIDASEASRLPFSICTKDGCRAAVQMTGEMVEDLKRGKQLVLTFAGPNAKAYKVPVSLAGFTKAYDNLQP
jgi:invasion protein IalB